MPRPLRLRGLLLGAVCACTLATAGPAFAEMPRSVGYWVPPVAVSPAGEVVSAADDIDPDIFVRFAPPGGVLGAPERVSRNGVQPSIVAGPRGDSLAIWSTSNPPWRVMAAFRPPGGAFGRPVVITHTNGRDAPGYDAAFDAAGTATIVWSTSSAGVRVRTRSAAGRWAPGRRIGAVGDAGPRLIVSPSGAATVSWTRWRNRSSPTAVLSATRPAGGEFGAPKRVATAGPNANALIAGNDRGDAAIVWEQDDTKRELGPMSIHAAFRAGAEETFGPDTPLSRSGRHNLWPSASVAPDGRTVIAWTSFERTVEARIRTASGVLLPRRVLSRDNLEGTFAAALATGPGVVAWFDGKATVEDVGPDVPPGFLRTATASANGAFGRAHTWFTTHAFPESPFVFALGEGLLVMTPHGSIRRRARLP